MSDLEPTQPLFHVSNHHLASCGTPPLIDGDAPDRYHGYFVNDYGEQAVFVYDYQTHTGTLWMGDIGWDDPRTVIDGYVPDLILSQNEMVWLVTCWQTATAFRR